MVWYLESGEAATGPGSANGTTGTPVNWDIHKTCWIHWDDAAMRRTTRRADYQRNSKIQKSKKSISTHFSVHAQFLPLLVLCGRITSCRSEQLWFLQMMLIGWISMEPNSADRPPVIRLLPLSAKTISSHLVPRWQKTHHKKTCNYLRNKLVSHCETRPSVACWA